MSDSAALPIFAGVTGHRDIPPECAGMLEKQVESLLLGLCERYPRFPITVLSSLADGADRICAHAALKAGCRFSVPLPMAREDYERDFDSDSREEFRKLLKSASGAFVVEPLEPAPGDTPPRGFYYRQAGLYIAKNAHLLIALWNGEETLFSGGGGTYETICLARREHVPVYHIPTPRLSNPTISPPSKPIAD